jgi:prefoldin subunit 5
MSQAMADLARQNDYLKTRNAQLQNDVTELGADNTRLREELERVMGRRAARAATNPISGGQ